MITLAIKVSQLIGVFLLALLVLLPGSATSFENTSTREGEAGSGWHGLLPIINKFLDSIRSGNIADAYKTYTTKELQKTTSVDDFKKLVDEASVLKNNKLFSFLTFYFDNGVAIFQGTLISIHGETLQAEFDLKQEGADWKIDGVHLFKPELTAPPQENIYKPLKDKISMAPMTKKLWQLTTFDNESENVKE